MNKDKLVCGVVIPISEIDGCTETHWADVLDIITEAIERLQKYSKEVLSTIDKGAITFLIDGKNLKVETEK